MKRFAALFLAIAWGASLAQSAGHPVVTPERKGKTTNFQIEGNLAATRDLPCVNLADAKPAYTPADLLVGFQKCISQKDFDKAVHLFVLAGIYSQFDAARVADPSAQGGRQVLVMNTFANMSQEQKNTVEKAMEKFAAGPDELKAACSEVRRIGPPSYFPKYLVLHGTRAFTSAKPLEHALKPDFDSKTTWARLQDAYLHCPK